jgi:hypothetical protein
MAASLEIGNGCQSPRISFTFDFSQTEPERTTNDRQSPRISFSLNISQTDRISTEKQKRDVADVNCDTDFEFCVNGLNSIIGESLLPVADELFVDGKILPLVHHVSLENLKCLSPVRSTSSPSSEITSTRLGNVASKSLRHKPPNKWKEMVFKLSKKESVSAENRRASFKVVDQSQPSSMKPLSSFSRSCRTGGEMKGNGLFRSLSFSRSHSSTEPKYKAATSGCTSKEIETGLSGQVEGAKPPEAWSINNKVQPELRYYGELKPRFEADGGKEETKAKQYTAGRGKLGSPGLPVSRMRRGMSSQQITERFGANSMSMVRNLESPPPGKTMVEGSLFVKAKNSIGGRGVRVSPVVNVPVCIAHAGGRWNGGGSLFGFFSKREKKRPEPSA